MGSPQTLAQRVRTKYPGAYDDLSDQQIEAAVMAKFPGVYDDIPKTQAAPVTTVDRVKAAIAAGDPEDAKKRDRLRGVAKGAGNTVFGLGKMARDYTPVGRVSDAIMPGAFDQRPKELVPTNADQRLGYAAEQIGEFLLPVGAAGKIGKAADVGKSALMTKAQTGSTADAGVSAAISAALPPVMSMAGTAAGALTQSARKSMAQALGATKEWAKSEAARLAPEMLARGVKGSRPAMLAQAKAVSARVGDELTAAYMAATQAGETVPGLVIRGHVQIARDALKIRNAAGARVVIPGTERVVQTLDELDAFIGTLGDDIPVDKAVIIKRTWDGIVSKAGLFGPKATASATDSADAYAIREASGAFREMLNGNPTIAELNKELSFWVGLKKVLKETAKRTQAQRGGLTDAIRGTGGAVAGAAVGGPLGAGLGQVTTQQLSGLINSPWFKTTVSGPFKQSLANALASGIPERIQSVVSQIAAAMPSQLRPAASQ
jgi:hypothetical protein